MSITEHGPVQRPRWQSFLIEHGGGRLVRSLDSVKDSPLGSRVQVAAFAMSCPESDLWDMTGTRERIREEYADAARWEAAQAERDPAQVARQQASVAEATRMRNAGYELTTNDDLQRVVVEQAHPCLARSRARRAGSLT